MRECANILDELPHTLTALYDATGDIFSLFWFKRKTAGIVYTLSDGVKIIVTEV